MQNEWKTVKLIQRKMISVDTLSLTFVGKDLPSHIPGQFYLIKASESNDTNFSREYSLANKPNSENIVEFGIQKVPNGVVSSYLHDLKEGEDIQIKGPMGKYFNWDVTHSGPVVFIVGGSGIVPIMSMLRSHPQNELHLLASFQTLDHFSYLDELQDLTDELNLTFVPTLTREVSSGWRGNQGRIDEALLHETLTQATDAKIFICGRSEFVESIFIMLLKLGVDESSIQRERFG